MLLLSTKKTVFAVAAIFFSWKLNLQSKTFSIIFDGAKVDALTGKETIDDRGIEAVKDHLVCSCICLRSDF